jgi:hypothetical protein
MTSGISDEEPQNQFYGAGSELSRTILLRNNVHGNGCRLLGAIILP